MNAAPVQSGTKFRVPITTYLRGSAYRSLASYAARHDTTVGEVLAQLADKATTPHKRRRPKVYLSPDQVEWLVTETLVGTRQTKIAETLGVSVAQVNNRLRERGLRPIDREKIR